MYLAIKEMFHEKLRYSLIIGMVLLVSYLVYILSGLAVGLAQQNTQAINSWEAQSVILDKDSNTSLQQSLITKDQAKKININKKTDSYVGQSAVVAKDSGQENISAQFIGLDTNQAIYKKIKVYDGKKSIKDNQIVVDQKFKEEGYKLNDEVKFNSDKQKYKIVGFTKNAKLNIAPVVYGDLKTWRTLKNLPNTFEASGIFSTKDNLKSDVKQLKTYSIQDFITELPGYQAQNTTFTFMIVFLMVISIIVIAVFLYILTMQKIPNYAVLRAQGVPAKTLIGSTIAQAFLIVGLGLILGAILTIITGWALPLGVPISFDYRILGGVTIGILFTGIIGSLIPARIISKVDPASMI